MRGVTGSPIKANIKGGFLTTKNSKKKIIKFIWNMDDWVIQKATYVYALYYNL